MTYINREPLKVVAQIIQHELGLDDFHVVDGNEKFDIPTDQKLFVALFDEGTKPVSRMNRFDPSTNSEMQSHTLIHSIRIEVCSLISDEARKRKEEVSMALDSIYAQQTMEQYQCSVASFSTFTNATAAEVSGMLKRYSATVNVTAIHGKVQPVSYFDKFNNATVPQTTLPPEVNESQ